MPWPSGRELEAGVRYLNPVTRFNAFVVTSESSV